MGPILPVLTVYTMIYNGGSGTQCAGPIPVPIPIFGEALANLAQGRGNV